MIRLLITLFVFVLLSCDLVNPLPDPEPVPVGRFNSIEMQGKTVTFDINCVTPELCWEYSSYDKSTSDYLSSITVYGQRTTNNLCAQEVSSFDVAISISVPSAGNYTFKFWQRSDSTLDTTVFVE